VSTSGRTPQSNANTRPFRAEHVGSLLRPPALTAARQKHQRGELTAGELRSAEDAAIRDVIRMQEDVGLQAITDGELRRNTWHMDFLYQLGGVTRVQQNKLKVRFHNETGDIEWTPAALAVTSPLHLKHTIFADDFSFLAAETRGVPKLTIPSPSMIHYRGGRSAIDAAVYPQMSRFWIDLQNVYAQQIEKLSRLGCTYLQLDDTSLAYLNDPAQREHVTAIGGDARNQHIVYIENMNGVLARKPADMTVCVHLCRGNFRSSWVASGGYDFVAEALFNELNVDGFFLEYDDERSGDFTPLRFVPKGKRVVLGLVTSKRGALESKDEIKRRIDAAAKFVPLDQICLSPQCGFASTVEGNALTFDEQRAKLALVVETAREIWGD
jgi:5-methyltetrahydropteroyltriglutamate--homocysteine methyltransferase